MTLKEAESLFLTQARRDAVESLLSDRSGAKASLRGLPGSAFAMLLAGLKKRRKPLLIVARDASEAGYIYNDLCQIAGDRDTSIFPSGYKRDIKYGQPDPPARILRTEVIDRLHGSDFPQRIVTYPEALAEMVADKESLSASRIELRTGQTVKIADLIKQLFELGFHQTDYVYEPGQYARRGSIVDVFSFSNELPFRIDFFDDEIDSIRTFDIETQLSAEKRKEASIVAPAAADTSGGVSLLHLLGDRNILLTQDPEYVLSRVEAICAETMSDAALLAGESDEKALEKTVDADDFRADFKRMRLITWSAQSPSEKESEQAGLTIDFHCTLQTLYHKNFDLITENFSRFESDGYRILMLSDSAHQADRLRAIFADRGDKITFTAVDRTIHEGFVDHDAKICYFTDHQIFDRFHNYSLRSDKARGGKLALSLKELNQIEIGDYIVHIDHGIGRFGGLVKTSVNGTPQEMIKLFYQNNDLVLVSIHALHKLSKYRGKDGVEPKISKLGGGAWNRLKERAKTKLKEIGRDLINLYAARSREQGFAFSPDSYLQQELEASFIYEDTPDQLKATQAVKHDMESSRPMDRLVCGDVGFGKTEIAIRAAFKAATDGKQTAVLVPTTVLAMQHYHTFAERLRDLPVRVEFISRAKKPKEVRQILADLAEGKIDILIGTHKLIGKSVKFKDLGLLIVDEEQKFGVTVKEKLKQMKVNVDTLTMSATPIPRTLQFSLMGARDLSTLNTPPANRQPVETCVGTLCDETIREAVSFELSRNGQVFFISNRIENLHDMEAKVRRIVPDAKVVIAHGQMPPEQLEKAIIDFSNHDYDVLLATTIVENGIDMPNVNTIIVNNAHNFGLSELHQLRGRVGRSNRKAFCYLLVPPGAQLTPVARRRLHAIESFSGLGSGIQIAMQDLDIRGAGNLLGAEQSGFISDLGYEAYQQILRETLVELKTEEFGSAVESTSTPGAEEFTSDVTIESDLELRLPQEYVPQDNERITLYRELDKMEREEETETFRAHLRDRFGPIPQVTEELILVPIVRMLGKRLGMERIVLKGGVMRIFFTDNSNQAYYNSHAFSRVLSYVQSHVSTCHFKDAGGKNLIIIDNIKSVSAALATLREIIASPVIPTPAAG